MNVHLWSKFVVFYRGGGQILIKAPHAVIFRNLQNIFYGSIYDPHPSPLVPTHIIFAVTSCAKGKANSARKENISMSCLTGRSSILNRWKKEIPQSIVFAANLKSGRFSHDKLPQKRNSDQTAMTETYDKDTNFLKF